MEEIPQNGSAFVQFIKRNAPVLIAIGILVLGVVGASFAVQYSRHTPLVAASDTASESEASETPSASTPSVQTTVPVFSTRTDAVMPGTPSFVTLEEIVPIEGSEPLGYKAPSSFFDDVVFIGDSVTMRLDYYEYAHNVLGDAAFLTSTGFGTNEALLPVSAVSVHPSYCGVKNKIEALIPLTGKHKVYLMLGLNDVGWSSTENAVARMETLCDSILSANRGVTLYLQSVTPLSENSNLFRKGFTKQKVQDYNAALAALCARRGWHFINVAAVMYTPDGYLKSAYCNDPDGMGVHFNDAGCAAWVQYLYTHAGEYEPTPMDTSSDDHGGVTSRAPYTPGTASTPYTPHTPSRAPTTSTASQTPPTPSSKPTPSSTPSTPPPSSSTPTPSTPSSPGYTSGEIEF